MIGKAVELIRQCLQNWVRWDICSRCRKSTRFWTLTENVILVTERNHCHILWMVIWRMRFEHSEFSDDGGGYGGWCRIEVLSSENHNHKSKASFTGSKRKKSTYLFFFLFGWFSGCTICEYNKHICQTKENNTKRHYKWWWLYFRRVTRKRWCCGACEREQNRDRNEYWTQKLRILIEIANRRAFIFWLNRHHRQPSMRPPQLYFYDDFVNVYVCVYECACEQMWMFLMKMCVFLKREQREDCAATPTKAVVDGW